jgi:hypothetical protein
MWKCIVALLALLAIGVASGATIEDAIPVCTDCYANVITQTDSQVIEDVILGAGTGEKDGVGNEALSGAFIITPKFAEAADNGSFMVAPFARIDQKMEQTISGLGSKNLSEGSGAKGLTWNKAIQAAWIANQGLKEKEMNGTQVEWVKEGSYIAQTTVQTTKNVTDYDTREEAKVLNLDNKLAMIVDDLNATIRLIASAQSASDDTQNSSATIENDVNVTVSAIDP